MSNSFRRNTTAGGVALQGNTSYQVDGNLVTLKVDRVVNNGQGTTGSLRLELWATSSAYSGGTISGYALASYQFPSQLGPGQYYYNINEQVGLTPPPGGLYSVTLTLEEYTGNGWVIRDFVTYNSTANFGGGSNGSGGLTLEGNTSWQIQNNTLTMSVDRVSNHGSGTTGSVRLELWATQAPYGGGTIRGYILGAYQFDSQLGPGQYFYNIAVQVPAQMPPDGVYYTTLTLEEYTASGWVIRDSATYASTTSFGSGNNGGNGGNGNNGGDPCALKPINTWGSPVTGVLTANSCLNSGFNLDAYAFTAVAGSQLTIVMQSPDFYTFQVLFGPGGGDALAAVQEGWTDGQTVISLTVPATGEYHLLATSNDPNTGGPGGLGSYTLTVTVF